MFTGDQTKQASNTIHAVAHRQRLATFNWSTPKTRRTPHQCPVLSSSSHRGSLATAQMPHCSSITTTQTERTGSNRSKEIVRKAERAGCTGSSISIPVLLKLSQADTCPSANTYSRFPPQGIKKTRSEKRGELMRASIHSR